MSTKLRSIELRFVREIRDPVYGYVYTTNYEDPILDSAIFQRLNRIHQMPTAQFVYPSARHPRKVHSLGVAHLSHKAILNILYRQHEYIQANVSPLFWCENVVVKELEKEKGLDNLSQPLREKWWNEKELDVIVQSVRIAGMLHDIGHAPFTHLFEDICTVNKIKMKFDGRKHIFSHELMSRKIVQEREEELGLRAPFKADYVNQILDSKGDAPPFLCELINGGYDCDKLDYLVRDAMATGTIEFGLVDVARVLSGLRVKDENLCISLSALDALIESFDAVQYMYTSVYYHKTARIFDFMIEEALSRMKPYLEEMVSDTDKFLEHDDYNFILKVRTYLQNQNDNDSQQASRILESVMKREKKYKEVFCHRISIRFLLDTKMEGLLRDLEGDLIDTAGELNIRVDYKPHVKPIGIELQQIPVWLHQDRIFDPKTGVVRPLKDFSRAYYERLRKYTILFRVYADRMQLANDVRGTFTNNCNRIVKLAEEKLREIEDRIED